MEKCLVFLPYSKRIGSIPGVFVCSFFWGELSRVQRILAQWLLALASVHLQVLERDHPIKDENGGGRSLRLQALGRANFCALKF